MVVEATWCITCQPPTAQFDKIVSTQVCFTGTSYCGPLNTYRINNYEEANDTRNIEFNLEEGMHPSELEAVNSEAFCSELKTQILNGEYE